MSLVAKVPLIMGMALSSYLQASSSQGVSEWGMSELFHLFAVGTGLFIIFGGFVYKQWARHRKKVISGG
ncbi:MULTISPECIES: hypothetical protein [Marinomonas]|uniref:Uncharacterized protein n=1 Tax=Marinomonas alcarazii TaxID=491949 RepID=A0A318V6S5_9GAMM|nr:MULTISPECIES: hypothetical protein [Marinomonas]PYF83501.1 hypothetical protein DFP75_102597 [Marinomonas alcarazii]